MPTDLRELITRAIEEHIEVTVNAADEVFDLNSTHAVNAILALPEIAEALAGRDAVLEGAAEHFDEKAKATPLGHEDRQRGASTYNWLKSCAAAIRAMKAGPAPAADAAAVRKAALEEAARFVEAITDEADESDAGERVADAFNDRYRSSMNDRVADHGRALAREIRALADAPGGDDA